MGLLCFGELMLSMHWEMTASFTTWGCFVLVSSCCQCTERWLPVLQHGAALFWWAHAVSAMRDDCQFYNMGLLCFGELMLTVHWEMTASFTTWGCFVLVSSCCQCTERWLSSFTTWGCFVLVSSCCQCTERWLSITDSCLVAMDTSC